MANTKIPVELSSTPGIVDGSNATAITIDSSENVGIGTTSPGDTLHIVTDSSTTNDTVDVARIEATSSGTPAAGFGPTIDFRGERGSASSDSMGRIGYVADTMTASRIDGAFIVETAVDGTYSENLRVTSTGKVGIGTTSPDRKLHLNEAASSTSNFIHLTTADTGTTGSNGFLVGIGSDGAAELFNYEAQPISFATSGTERMRIDSSGNVLVGTTSAYGTTGTTINAAGLVYSSADGDRAGQFDRTTSDGELVRFSKAGTTVGSISTNSNSLPSDKNFKKNINNLDLGLNLIKKLKPSQYNYKVDDEDSPRMYGLIAQDLEESLTEVGVEKNSTWLLQHNPIEDEKQSDYDLDYGKLTPILIKAIQEQQTQIEALQSEINTLKGGD
jgi:hypothetical protein